MTLLIRTRVFKGISSLIHHFKDDCIDVCKIKVSAIHLSSKGPSINTLCLNPEVGLSIMHLVDCNAFRNNFVLVLKGAWLRWTSQVPHYIC